MASILSKCYIIPLIILATFWEAIVFLVDPYYYVVVYLMILCMFQLSLSIDFFVFQSLLSILFNSVIVVWLAPMCIQAIDIMFTV